MSSKTPNSRQYEEFQLPFSENLTGLPDTMAASDEFTAAVQRGVDYAKEILNAPDTQMLPLPGQSAISDTPRRIPAELATSEATPIEVTPERAVLGSRARGTHGASPAASHVPPQEAFGNPYGRSKAGLEQEKKMLYDQYNHTAAKEKRH